MLIELLYYSTGTYSLCHVILVFPNNLKKTLFYFNLEIVFYVQFEGDILAL